MQVLSSFIPYRNKRKPKPKPPFPNLHYASSRSHPYASADVIDIKDRTNQVAEEVLTTESLPIESAPLSASPPESTSVSPRVDVDISSEPTDWLSLGVFKQESFSVDLVGDFVGEGDSGNQKARGSSETNEDVVRDGDDEFTSDDEFLTDLKAMNVSHLHITRLLPHFKLIGIKLPSVEFTARRCGETPGL